MRNSAIDSYVRAIMRKRDLTLLTLCDMLGYRSPTSLTRIMQGSANRESLLKFAGRLRACVGLALTREENSALDDLIELHDIGDQDYVAMVAMRRMIRGEAIVPDKTLMLQWQDGTKRSFFAHYSTLKVRSMLILNSESVPLFHDLALMLTKKPFPVEHYMFAGNHPLHTVQCLHAAMPVMYSEPYQSYSYSIVRDPAMTTRGIITSDALFCEYEDTEGQIVHEMTIFVASDLGLAQKITRGSELMRFVLPPRDELCPIRVSVPDYDILQYNVFCLDLERNCGVYRIKTDIGIEQIPVPILKRAVAEHAPADVVAVLDLLAGQFERRQENILTKRAPQYHIMKRRAMWQFIQTGRMSDHLWCCRSFTMQERLEILTFIRDELMQKADFHLHFLKDDDALRDDEITLYEGKGLSIIKPGTDYNLQKDHVECLIKQTEFISFFKRFFMESTMRYRVETEEMSRNELDRMIDFCRNSVDA